MERVNLNEQHELQPSVSRNERVMSLAVSTPLPESTEGSLDEDSIRNSLSDNEAASGVPINAAEADKSNSRPHTYMEKINILSRRFPHLRRVRIIGDASNVSIDCYDFHEGFLKSLRTFSNESNETKFLSDEGKNLQDTLRCVDEGELNMRLLVATDLSRSLIEFLGSHFDMNLSFSRSTYWDHTREITPDLRSRTIGRLEVW